MKPVFLVVAASAFLLLLSSNLTTAKNVSVGIYAIVEQVAFEPDAASPNFVRITGVFVVPVSLSSGSYRSARRGYLHFRITPGTEQVTRRDWDELKSFAGSGKVIAFGQYWVPNPDDPQGNPHHSLAVRVQTESNRSAAPDFYPIPRPGGVTEVKGWDKSYDPDSDKIVAQLRDVSHR